MKSQRNCVGSYKNYVFSGSIPLCFLTVVNKHALYRVLLSQTVKKLMKFYLLLWLQQDHYSTTYIREINCGHTNRSTACTSSHNPCSPCQLVTNYSSPISTRDTSCLIRTSNTEHNKHTMRSITFHIKKQFFVILTSLLLWLVHILQSTVAVPFVPRFGHIAKTKTFNKILHISGAMLTSPYATRVYISTQLYVSLNVHSALLEGMAKAKKTTARTTVKITLSKTSIFRQIQN